MSRHSPPHNNFSWGDIPVTLLLANFFHDKKFPSTGFGQVFHNKTQWTLCYRWKYNLKKHLMNIISIWDPISHKHNYKIWWVVLQTLRITNCWDGVGQKTWTGNYQYIYFPDVQHTLENIFSLENDDRQFQYYKI